MEAVSRRVERRCIEISSCIFVSALMYHVCVRVCLCTVRPSERRHAKTVSSSQQREKESPFAATLELDPTLIEVCIYI